MFHNEICLPCTSKAAPASCLLGLAAGLQGTALHLSCHDMSPPRAPTSRWFSLCSRGQWKSVPVCQGPDEEVKEASFIILSVKSPFQDSLPYQPLVTVSTGHHWHCWAWVAVPGPTLKPPLSRTKLPLPSSLQHDMGFVKQISFPGADRKLISHKAQCWSSFIPLSCFPICCSIHTFISFPIPTMHLSVR